MTIAIIGAGAVGCWMASELSAAGADVTVVARGEALRAVRERGVRADGVDVPVAVATHASEVEASAIVLATKATGAPLTEILDGTNAPIVMTQNSVEAPRLIAAVVGQERTVPGVVRGYFHHVGPAEVTTHGGPGSFTMGPGAPRLPGRWSPRASPSLSGTMSLSTSGRRPCSSNPAARLASSPMPTSAPCAPRTGSR